MIYGNSKYIIDAKTQKKIGYKFTEKFLCSLGMLEEVFSLYTQILDCQKTAATYLKEGNHQLKNLPIHKNTVWQLDRFWDCEILKDYRYQTMQYVGVFLSKYAYIFTKQFQNLYPNNEMISSLCLFSTKLNNCFCWSSHWNTFSEFLCKFEHLIVFILMRRYEINNEKKDFLTVHYKLKTDIHSYMLSAGFMFTPTGEYIRPISSKCQKTHTHEYHRPFFSVYKALHLISCSLNNHEIEKEIVEVRSCDQRKTIHLPVHYCLTCGRFFLGQQTLEVYEREYGRLDFDFRYDNNWLDGCTITDSYDYEHNGESKLHQLGYNVIQNYYSEETRHKILINLLEIK
jgi:hypothetical protein